MAKGRKRRPGKAVRLVRATPASTPREPSLITDVRTALSARDPLEFLSMLSSLLAAIDPRGADPFERDPEPSPSLEELTGSFVDEPRSETSALLAGIAELVGDDLTRARIRRVLADRGHALPRWLTELGDARITGVSELVHVLGDGDDVLVGVRLPGGSEITFVVYIDHNLGTVVKDAFVVPEPIGTVSELMDRVADDPDQVRRALEPADARVRISEAIEHGARMYPPLESESWPACRPLVEWAARLLPAGGTGYARPEWDAPALAELTERFFGSSVGRDLDDAVRRHLLDSLLWFGTDYGPGDPLRWSPVAVEILLVDWIPRKIVAEADHLARAPELLRAFIRFCHAERGIRAALTEETLGAVDTWEPEYQRTIRAPRRQGAEALLDAMGLFDTDDHLDSVPEIMLDSLRRAVGGPAALERLDATPLADEPLRLRGVPVDVHDRLTEVAALVDRCCAELFDIEVRTAARRFLARAAAGDPDAFRRKSRAETSAAAVCWVIGKANQLFSQYPGQLMVKDLMAHFGLKNASVSQRARVLLRAGGFEDDQYGAMNLDTPDLLTSKRRGEIVELRDHYRSKGDASP